MTDERVEPFTKESLDTLIDELRDEEFHLNPSQKDGALLLRDAILAHQPERVECPTNHRYVQTLPYPPQKGEDGIGPNGSYDWRWRTYTSPFCPDCGQSLKGASE